MYHIHSSGESRTTNRAEIVGIAVSERSHTENTPVPVRSTEPEKTNTASIGRNCRKDKMMGNGKIEFDFKAIINAALIAGMDNRDDINSKRCAAIMKVFQKYGIDVMQATAFLAEVAAAVEQVDKDNK